MRCYFVLLTLICASLLSAQDLVPRPYAFAGGKSMGGGYAPLAAIGGGGIRIDSRHCLLDAEGQYDTGHKVNDNDQPNPNGHNRRLVGSAYYRLPSGWSFGAGVRWSQLSTTNYTKSSWAPTFGGSKDYFHNRCQQEKCARDFSMQLGADYMLAGSNWQNGAQGPLLTFYVPSPSGKTHIFWRETVGIYRFYDSVTDRTNATLTREQMSNHSWETFVEFTMMYRF
jgi:hypothetical protein